MKLNERGEGSGMGCIIKPPPGNLSNPHASGPPPPKKTTYHLRGVRNATYLSKTALPHFHKTTTFPVFTRFLLKWIPGKQKRILKNQERFFSVTG